MNFTNSEPDTVNDFLFLLWSLSEKLQSRGRAILAIRSTDVEGILSFQVISVAKLCEECIENSTDSELSAEGDRPFTCN